MKFTIPSKKPLNPLVVPMRFRAGGSHRQSPAALRQKARRILHEELRAMTRPSP